MINNMMEWECVCEEVTTIREVRRKVNIKRRVTQVGLLLRRCSWEYTMQEMK